MALGPGSIAFVGINSAATQGDWLAFVVLQDIPAGTTIYLTDNELTSATSGTFNSGESFSKWVAPSAGVTAGTVVTITAFDTTAPLASLGAASPVTVANSANRGLATGSDVVYAYLADAATPSVPTTFLAYVNLGSAVDGVAPSTLSGGAAVSVTTGQDGMVYAGPTTGLADFAAYAAAIGDTANWTKVAAGVAPTQVVSGFSTSLTYAAQTVAFSAASVSVAEGDAGTTTVTFTVTRAGGTDGEVSFDGSFVPGTGLDGADFAAGVIPTAFSGTIAAGAASATVTVAIAGDVVVEDNETFTLTLRA